MEETIDSGYQDFVAAFDGDGNQTVTDQETGAQAEEQADTEQETTVTDEGAEKPDGGTGEDTGGEVDAPEESDKPDAEQTFTIKVNKEERTVGLAEMTALAQKGADYDRVKERAQQTIQELKTQLDGQKDVMEIMTTLAEKTSWRKCCMSATGRARDARRRRRSWSFRTPGCKRVWTQSTRRRASRRRRRKAARIGRSGRWTSSAGAIRRWSSRTSL